MKPKDFLSQPTGSVLRKSEAETVARNIMAILSQTGNEWRRLTWDEYKAARLKEGNFTEGELVYFEQGWPYTVSAEAAALFSPEWKRVTE